MLPVAQNHFRLIFIQPSLSENNMGRHGRTMSDQEINLGNVTTNNTHNHLMTERVQKPMFKIQNFGTETDLRKVRFCGGKIQSYQLLMYSVYIINFSSHTEQKAKTQKERTL